MSRSTLIFSLIAELLLGSAAFAKSKAQERAEKCLANCDVMQGKLEKSCKGAMPNGRCEGRGKGLVDDFEKRCREECSTPRKKKK